MSHYIAVTDIAMNIFDIKFCFLQQNTMPCPDYLVLTYTLVLEDSEGNRLTQLEPITGMTTIASATFTGLMENLRYRYYSISNNQFGGNHESAPVEIGKSSLYCVCTYHLSVLHYSDL